MAVELPNLPYAMDALAPHISPSTLEYHYGKHHRAYVTNLNKLIADSSFDDESLDDIVYNTQDYAIFNNAAQVWNHTFYWNCLSPTGGGEPKAKLLSALEKDFGSVESFKEQFTQKALTLFGSGWAWLVKDKQGNLRITQEGNAGTPITKDLTPLLTCDVWEHAYYLDYKNARPKYLDAFWELVNWNYAEEQLVR